MSAFKLVYVGEDVEKLSTGYLGPLVEVHNYSSTTTQYKNYQWYEIKNLVSQHKDVEIHTPYKEEKDLYLHLAREMSNKHERLKVMLHQKKSSKRKKK